MINISRITKTKLFSHQAKMIEWCMKRIVPTQRLMCRAYMSAGKTLTMYEIALQTLTKQPDSFALVLVPATVINVWIDEAKKHYPSLVPKKIEARRILFCHSRRELDKKAILEGNIKGKVVVGTPSSVDPALEMLVARGPAVLLLDEAHRMLKAYKTIITRVGVTPVCYFTASHSSVSGVTDKYELNGAASKFPDVRYLIQEDKDVLDLLRAETSSHVCVVYSTAADAEADLPRLSATGRTVYDYIEHTVTAYRRYEKQGGILVTCIRAISEGNNLNNTQAVFIVNPRRCIAETIKQCVGRVYRESNTNSQISVHMVVDSEDVYTYARCRLACAGVYSISGTDAKPSSEEVHKYLAKNGYDFRKLTDGEAVCVYTKNDNKNGCKKMSQLPEITPTTIPMHVMVKCMLM